MRLSILTWVIINFMHHNLQFYFLNVTRKLILQIGTKSYLFVLQQHQQQQQKSGKLEIFLIFCTWTSEFTINNKLYYFVVNVGGVNAFLFHNLLWIGDKNWILGYDNHKKIIDIVHQCHKLNQHVTLTMPFEWMESKCRSFPKI